MLLTSKESLFQAPVNSTKRTKRLVTDDERVQVQSAILCVRDVSGDDHELLQLKFWTKELGSWSMAIYNDSHDILCAVGPFHQEKMCWRAVTVILRNKGYWSGDLEG
jgi:hypothetical protein